MGTRERTRDNPWRSIILDVAIPALVLSRLSSPDRLGPKGALVLALAFPFFHGIWGYLQSRQVQFFAVVGFVGVLLTGGMGLFEFDTYWFAVKEAAVPSIIGCVVLASEFVKYPIVQKMLLNEDMVDVPLLEQTLARLGQEDAFRQRLRQATWILAGSFFLSATLNFVLARMVLQSPSGTEAFNNELARMTALSYPVIVLPSMVCTGVALWWLFSGVKSLTGLSLEQLFHKSSADSR